MASELRRLTRALAFAAEAHRNHRRKGASQEPYINHLIEVADLVASVEDGDVDVLIAALLHDVLEDTGTGYDELAAAFGERVARIVQENSDDMTLPKPERQRTRLAGISKKSREARLVKFADIISNLRAIAVSPPAGWSNDRRLGYLDSCRNLVDAGRGSNAEIERIFDDTKQRSRPSGPKASAMSMAELQRGASSRFPSVSRCISSTCRTRGAGGWAMAISTCSVERSRERFRRPRCKQQKAFTKAGADRCSSEESGRTAPTRSWTSPSVCASRLTSPLSASRSMDATSASMATTPPKRLA